MNLFKLFQSLSPQAPLQVGVVTAYSGGVAVVTMPDGGKVIARGSAALNDRVWVRDGVIEGAAPTLPFEQISV